VKRDKSLAGCTVNPFNAKSALTFLPRYSNSYSYADAVTIVPGRL